MDDVDRCALLDTWFRAYADRVLAYLQHRTDPQTAQDLLQEVFMIAFVKAPELPQPPLGWLFGTARRVLANRYRGRRRQDELIARLIENAGPAVDVDAGPDAGSDGHGRELQQAFAQTLATLSSADRDVLTLAGWYDLTPAEAADALGCTPAAYAVRLHRARKRLARALDDAGYSGDGPAAQFAEALRGEASDG